MKKVITFALLAAASVSVSAQQYGPYNQQYTMNQQYGSTNWYSSALGAGVASAGVAIIGGLVNAMSRPDPVQVQQQQPQVIYVNQGQYQPQQGTTYDLQRNNNCQMQTVYDQYGNPRNVNVCP